MRWLALCKPGDWLLGALALFVCVLSFRLTWVGGPAESALIRRGGEVFAELDLSRNRQIDVPGPLGVTTIRVEEGRVRVLADPGPRQLCVHQGWLKRAGEVAICAPNEVSVEVRRGRQAYDSLSY